MVNFNRNAKELVDLHRHVYEELNEIKNFALIGPGDKLFVDRFLRFLLGHGELADFANYDKVNYEPRDSGRMYIALTVVTLADPDRIDADRLETIKAYFNRPKVRDWESDPHFGTSYLRKAGFLTV